MNFEAWEPIYESILAEFGYPREGDERARDAIADYATPFDFDRLGVPGETVAVVGAAPSLPGEVGRVDDADLVFAASTAADVVREAGYTVDLLVTDLDKNPETARALTEADTPVAAHAHGDNLDLIEEWVPKLDPAGTIATTQASPIDAVYNFGGFTDGDRAAFLADDLGAAELRFVGWDFDDPTVDAEKARKLQWAERLLHLLERRRGERFGVLDGRRDGIEPLPMPDD